MISKIDISVASIHLTIPCPELSNSRLLKVDSCLKYRSKLTLNALRVHFFGIRNFSDMLIRIVPIFFLIPNQKKPEINYFADKTVTKFSGFLY